MGKRGKRERWRKPNIEILGATYKSYLLTTKQSARKPGTLFLGAHVLLIIQTACQFAVKTGLIRLPVVHAECMSYQSYLENKTNNGKLTLLFHVECVCAALFYI